MSLSQAGAAAVLNFIDKKEKALSVSIHGSIPNVQLFSVRRVVGDLDQLGYL